MGGGTDMLVEGGGHGAIPEPSKPVERHDLRKMTSEHFNRFILEDLDLTRIL